MKCILILIRNFNGCINFELNDKTLNTMKTILHEDGQLNHSTFQYSYFRGFSPIIIFKKIKNFQYLQLDPIFYKKHS